MTNPTTSMSSFVVFTEVNPWNGEASTLKFWICRFQAWYDETRKAKFNSDVEKAYCYVLMHLHGKEETYTEMKLDELEAVKADSNYIFDEATLISLLIDLQEFFKVKTSAQQSLEHLKKMTQGAQSIDELHQD